MFCSHFVRPTEACSIPALVSFPLLVFLALLIIRRQNLLFGCCRCIPTLWKLQSWIPNCRVWRRYLIAAVLIA